MTRSSGQIERKSEIQKHLVLDASHLGQSLRNGLAVKRAPGVPAGASNLGLSGLTQVSSQVVFGLSGGGVDGGVLTEKGGDHVLLRGPLL